MILMALDHVRDFFSGAKVDPTNLGNTWPALFITRWITHYCAPVFMFLAGTSGFFAGTRRSRPELCRFLVSRGLWLVFLELTLVRFGWRWDLKIFESNAAATIWAIGWSMVCLGFLIFLPVRFVGAFGIGMIALHNLTDGIPPSQFGSLGWLWSVLHAGGVFQVPGFGTFGVSYPLIPWIGVMASGYAFGAVYSWEPERRRAFLLRTGLALIAVFVVLRATNFYGDSWRWSSQKNALFTAFSFVNCTKYPPSLLYVLMTIGPALIALAFLERPLGWWGRFVIVYGRVPLLYYLLHLPLIHGGAIVLAMVRGDTASAKFLSGGSVFGGTPEGFGYGLPVVYLVWIITVLVLYPVCAWFAGIKQRSKSPWLSYL